MFAHCGGNVDGMAGGGNDDDDDVSVDVDCYDDDYVIGIWPKEQAEKMENYSKKWKRNFQQSKTIKTGKNGKKRSSTVKKY